MSWDETRGAFPPPGAQALVCDIRELEDARAAEATRDAPSICANGTLARNIRTHPNYARNSVRRGCFLKTEGRLGHLSPPPPPADLRRLGVSTRTRHGRPVDGGDLANSAAGGR